jgi:hypothetical protein
MSTDQQIEAEIQAKGLTAARITPADIEASIACEHYFNAGEAAAASGQPAHQALAQLTICVLVMRNGFLVTGESACASPENFDAEVGKKVARANAVQKVLPLLGYELKQRMYPTPAMAGAVAALQIAAETCEANAPIHEAEGNHEQAECSRNNAASYRAAIARLTA